jgi:hypothetical protein
MLEAVVPVLARVLTVMFVVGLAGCCVAIPLVAYRLFSVLFERDLEEETKGK